MQRPRRLCFASLILTSADRDSILLISVPAEKRRASKPWFWSRWVAPRPIRVTHCSSPASAGCTSRNLSVASLEMQTMMRDLGSFWKVRRMEHFRLDVGSVCLNQGGTPSHRQASGEGSAADQGPYSHCPKYSTGRMGCSPRPCHWTEATTKR